LPKIRIADFIRIVFFADTVLQLFSKFLFFKY